MDLFSLFSFLLLLLHCFNTCQSDLATAIAAHVVEDDEHRIEGDVESLEKEDTLVVNTLEKDALEGMVVRIAKDNLTLSCTYHSADDKVVPADNMKLLWVLPNEDANRTTIWISEGVLWLTVRQLSSNDAGRYACIDTENSFFVAEVHLVVRSTFASPFPFCSTSSMFMCWGQESPPRGVKGPQCVLFSYLCDGRSDCPNGRDEQPETCFTDDPCRNKLMCADGRCIPKDWCCNGTSTRYGRSGYTCIPHPCCAQHYKVFDKFGGGWRKRPGSPPLLQMTLYTASFCVLIFLISITFLISIICRARLKRFAEMGRAAGTNGQRPEPPAVSSSPRCNYTLVPASCETPTSTYSAVLRRYFGPPIPNTTPPSYSQATADQQHDDAELPSYFEIQQETENVEPNSVQVRRPTDFGTSLLANTFFNARYRPVPQEIVSFGDVSDSDSSCRSPGSHTFNIYSSPSGARPQIGSPLSHLGETPEAYLARRSAEQRRIRRANALDRILDRFGLNAPYAVERDTTQNRTVAENSASAVSDEGGIVNGRRQFLSSILGRLRNSFNRTTPAIEQANDGNNETVNNETTATNNNDNSTGQTERRRPDTPDVLELSLDEIDVCRNATGDTFTLNGRTIHLLGASFEDRPDMYGLSLQGFYVVDEIVENLERFVGRPVSPPPYSEVANVAPPKIMGPPPPYKSRENLNSLISDGQPGPSCSNVGSSGNPVRDDERQLSIIVEAVPGTSGVGDSNVINNDNNQVLMEIVNCRDDSMSSLNLESVESREKDLQNGNVRKDESVNSFSLLDNENPSVTSDYSLKYTTNRGDLDNNNYDITSPSCSNVSAVRQSIARDSIVGRSDTLNDISNNNSSNFSSGETTTNNNRQLSLSTLATEQNGNPSTISSNVTADCARDLINKSQSVQRSVFPPISLEFIDSDCITE